jgi:hypothetical protein
VSSDFHVSSSWCGWGSWPVLGIGLVAGSCMAADDGDRSDRFRPDVIEDDEAEPAGRRQCRRWTGCRVSRT